MCFWLKRQIYRQKNLLKIKKLFSICISMLCLIIIVSLLFLSYLSKYSRLKSKDYLRLVNTAPESPPDLPVVVTGYTKDSNLSFNSTGLKLSAEGLLLIKRPWFLNNGSLRLSPKEASKLALWPEESADPSDDRVINQLLYVPDNYDREKSVPLKSIYLSTDDDDWQISLGRREFLKCPVSSCQLVPKVQANNADLIFFKSRYRYRDFITGRPSNQIWARFEIESPDNIFLVAPDNAINWTVTYRHDSDIPTPYYKFYPYEKSFNSGPVRNYAANKTRKVAWFVSNCFTTNGRLEYANELAKHIQVDIYGSCGHLNCQRGDAKCWDLLNTDYKFYLAFENSNCLDYITEKFWVNGLMNDVLPIVMGAHPSTYRRMSPPHSFIHVDDFESPEHLAKYLKLLDSNDELYNKYFQWKGTGEIKQIYMWCRICALLHAPQRHKTYEDLRHWWKSETTCVPITWTNMSINSSVTDVITRSVVSSNDLFRRLINF